MPGQLTKLFAAYKEGHRAEVDALVPVVYDELRRIARAHLCKERLDHTLQATALANEAYLKLSASGDMSFEDRQHFFAVASRQMRQILVDHARAKFAKKRGGRARPISFDEAAHVGLADNPLLLALDDAIEDLGERDERQAQVVQLRFFGGLTNRETADALGVSENTVKRDWAMARAWLSRELDKEQE